VKKTNNQLTWFEQRELNKIKKRIKHAEEKNNQMLTCFFMSKAVLEILKKEGYSISYYFDQTKYGVANLYIIQLNKK